MLAAILLVSACTEHVPPIRQTGWCSSAGASKPPDERLTCSFDWSSDQPDQRRWWIVPSHVSTRDLEVEIEGALRVRGAPGVTGARAMAVHGAYTGFTIVDLESAAELTVPITRIEQGVGRTWLARQVLLGGERPEAVRARIDSERAFTLPGDATLIDPVVVELDLRVGPPPAR